MKKSLRVFLIVVVLLTSIALPASAASHRIEVCHKGKTISVAAKAVKGHLVHGDWVVASDAPCP